MGVVAGPGRSRGRDHSSGGLVNGQDGPERTAGEQAGQGHDGQSVMSERIAAEQVGRISAEFKRQGVTVEYERTADGVVYLYAADQLLVREQDVVDVRGVLEPSVSFEMDRVDPIDGIKIVRF